VTERDLERLDDSIGLLDEAHSKLARLSPRPKAVTKALHRIAKTIDALDICMEEA
jgi:hypothetical protein